MQDDVPVAGNLSHDVDDAAVPRGGAPAAVVIPFRDANDVPLFPANERYRVPSPAHVDAVV